MSAEQPHKPNTGVLFPNSDKWREQKEGRPNYSGEISAVCPCCHASNRYRVAAWNQVGKQSGKPFLSVKLSEPQEKKGGGK